MADNDRSGLAAVLSEHRAELLRFVTARTGDAAEAEDLLQELWVKLSGNPPGPVANARSYLFRAVNNLVIDRVRQRTQAMRRDRSWLERDDEGPVTGERASLTLPADEALLVEEEAQVLRDAIGKLPDGARRALVAFRFEGIGQAEIAVRMGISRSGVEKHLSLAMKRLRQHLDDCGYFNPAPSCDEGSDRNDR